MRRSRCLGSFMAARAEPCPAPGLLLCLVALWISLSSAGSAQQRTTLRGVVSDTSGHPLPGVVVEVVTEAGLRTAITDARGEFRVQVPPGQCIVRASLAGFSTLEKTIEVEIGAANRIELTFDLGEIIPGEDNGDGEDEPPRGATPYYWNSWTDDYDELIGPQPAFEPVEHLAPDARFVVSLDLAGISYGLDRLGGTSRPTGRGFRDLLDSLAARPALKEYRLQPVLLTDPRFFETPAAVLQELVVDLDRVRSFAREESPVPENPISLLRQGGDPRFVFGRLSFELETSLAEGQTAVGLSFWHEGRPLEEISIPFCVAAQEESCQGPPPSTSLRGTGLLDLASEQTASRPAAALHILELSQERVVGVFSRNDRRTASTSDDYTIWTVSTNVQELVEQLRYHQSLFGEVDQDPIAIGDGMANILFPPDEPEARTARAAVTALFREYSTATLPFSRKNPPAVFIRTIFADLPQPALYPLELLNLTSHEKGFLGYYFRVETPLPRQSYAAASTCLVNWIPVLPPSDAFGALGVANQEMEDLRGVEDQVTLGGKRVRVYDDIGEFRRWIAVDQNDLDPTVIAVVSHHDRTSLYFESNRRVLASNISRAFVEPSVAILSGCSTSQFGASGFVRNLNRFGIDAVVATNTGISGRVAGTYVACLSNLLQGLPPGDGEELGSIHWGTLSCLYQRQLGAQALSFTLAGNPSLKLCVPAS